MFKLTVSIHERSYKASTLKYQLALLFRKLQDARGYTFASFDSSNNREMFITIRKSIIHCQKFSCHHSECACVVLQMSRGIARMPACSRKLLPKLSFYLTFKLCCLLRFEQVCYLPICQFCRLRSRSNCQPVTIDCHSLILLA